MGYQVLARKWRPLTFEDVVNQTHVKTTLVNAIKQDRIAHSYIFAGPRGIGKTTVARILARSLNCMDGPTPTPCNTCTTCREIIEDRSMDVLEIDGASNRGIEDVRNIRESVKYSPVHGKKRIYIIDEVHMLTREAFNALLKTLEEPPSHVLFIFATTEFHKIPTTIYSRCQRFDFKRLTLKEIVGQISMICGQEGISMTQESMMMLGKRAEGSMRDAQSLLDQLAAFCGNEISDEDLLEVLGLIREDVYFSCSGGIWNSNLKEAFNIAQQIFNEGHDLGDFLNGLLEHFRNLLVVKTSGDSSLVETTEAFQQRCTETAERFTEMDILRIINTISESEQSLKKSSQPLLRLELLLSKLFTMDNSVSIDRILEYIEQDKTGAPAKSSDTGNIVRKAPPAEPDQPPLPDIVEPAAPQQYEYVDKEPSDIAPPPAPFPDRIETPRQKPPAPSEALTLDIIKGCWDDFVNMIHKENALTGAFVGKCEPTGFTDNTIELTVRDGSSFTYDSILKYNKKIHAALKNHFQRDLTFSCIRGENKQAQKADHLKKTSANAGEEVIEKIIEREPVIKRIIDTFSGGSIRILSG